MNILNLSAAELARRLGDSELSALRVGNAYLEVIEERESVVRAWAALDPDLARREASTGDTAMNRLWTLLHGPCVTVPAARGPAGMPLGVQLCGLPGSDRRTLAAAEWAQRVLSS
jgi:Asp-tRNA(Asn)/Glu-tRNA(Gln) amidotransferase A subunit family amidase